MSVSIDRIESALDARGLEATFSGLDDYTSFHIVSGSKEIEILDAVSGGEFNAENLTEAILYGATTENVTQKFEDVQNVEEFLAAVAEVLA